MPNATAVSTNGFTKRNLFERKSTTTPNHKKTHSVRMLHDVLNEKNEDVEIVLQIAYTVFKLLLVSCAFLFVL